MLGNYQLKSIFFFQKANVSVNIGFFFLVKINVEPTFKKIRTRALFSRALVFFVSAPSSPPHLVSLSQVPTCKSIVSSNSGFRTPVLTSSAIVTSRVSVRYLPSIPLFLFLFGFFVASRTSHTRYLPCHVSVGLSI